MDFATKNKKGKIAEGIVKAALENKGYIVYTPTTPGAHSIDLFFNDKSANKIYAGEIKVVSSINYTMLLNLKHYRDYLEICKDYNLELFIVNPVHKAIYRLYFLDLVSVNIAPKIIPKEYNANFFDDKLVLDYAGLEPYSKLSKEEVDALTAINIKY